MRVDRPDSSQTASSYACANRIIAFAKTSILFHNMKYVREIVLIVRMDLTFYLEFWHASKVGARTCANINRRKSWSRPCLTTALA